MTRLISPRCEQTIQTTPGVTASPIGFPRVTGIGDLTRYCEQLAEAGVLLLPGSVYDQPDHIRIGFGRANMPDALQVLETNLTNVHHRIGRPRA